MAISAALVCTPSSVTNPLGGAKYIDVACTVTNTNSSDVTVLGVHPFVDRTAPVALGKPPIMPGQYVTVPASGGTLVLHWGAEFFSPTWASAGFPQDFASSAYTLGAIVYTSDGSVTTASTASFTVTAPAAP